MATLVLTAVGTAIGGPVGGAIGAIIGQSIDQQVFAPKARHGPRLGDLAVQTSSYGTQIPKIFGTMRVAGTVIWATELKEDRKKSGGGKGQPKTVTYSYSASFAVALSGRPIKGVRRIWADGKLLRGAGGDFKSETKYRLYPGSEDQAVDPLIASVEGAGQAPAHRGLAYAVFEDFQLADYGNRIPALTFELNADAGPVTIGDIAAELSEEGIAAGETPSLIGYAASGDSIRGAVEALGDVLPLSLSDREGVLLLAASPVEPLFISSQDAEARGDGGSGGRTEISRRAAAGVPGEVSIAYHDVDRDYQTGLQRATRGGPAIRGDRRSLPAVLSAGAAKAFAERRLAELWSARESGTLHLGWREAGTRAGDHLKLEGRGGSWKVGRWSLDRMVVGLEVVRVPSGGCTGESGGSPGRQVEQPDLPHGPTILFLLDLPPTGEEPASGPHIVAAAAGIEAGWRRAALLSSVDGEISWEPEGPTAAPSMMGYAVSLLDASGSELIDERSSVEVELLNEAMWLENKSDQLLAAGANAAMLGDELIQFGLAEPLGGRRFRLSRLLRGRRGTEWTAGSHIIGELFVLLEQESLKPLSATVGSELRLVASGIGDGAAARSAAIQVEGRAIQPPAPVHLSAEHHGNGDLVISWVRRSRSGWHWLSAVDTPLGEETEAYRLSIEGAGFERTVELTSARYIYSAAEQAEDGFSGAAVARVRQIGTYAASRAAELVIG